MLLRPKKCYSFKNIYLFLCLKVISDTLGSFLVEQDQKSIDAIGSAWRCCQCWSSDSLLLVIYRSSMVVYWLSIGCLLVVCLKSSKLINFWLVISGTFHRSGLEMLLHLKMFNCVSDKYKLKMADAVFCVLWLSCWV